jgi:carbon-monoxide dehydrogenase large subunit
MGTTRVKEIFKGRREDLRLVTGRGRYVSDWSFPNQLYGHFLRSDRGHADILSIDTEEARRIPGVIAILTSSDVIKAGLKDVPNLVRYPGKGKQLRVPSRCCLARERVRYVGQEVALVVAESALLAQDVAERIVIVYRDLPVVVDPAAALASDAPILHRDEPHNLAFEYEYGDQAATEKAFATAAYVAKASLDCQRLVGNPMEPKSCIAAYDPLRGVFEIYAPTQGSSMMQAELATIFGMKPEMIRVHAQDVGGAFGVRGEAYPEFIALALAARSVGRPVKWVGTRSESFLSDHHGRAERHEAELALDSFGNFLAIRVNWLVNVGAFCSNAGPFINTAAPQGQVAGLYKTPVVYGNHRLVFTNTTPTTAYRGAARPNAAYIVERLVDEASRLTGIGRVELRRRNLIPKTAFPYKTPGGAVYDSGDPPGLLDTVLRESDWSGFAKRHRDSKRRGKLRGIGLAMFVEPSGGGFKDEVLIKFGSSGGIELFAPVGPSGQGNETVFPEIVANIFDIAAENVVLRYNDPDGPPLVGLGSFGSRTLINHGNALAFAAREVVHKGVNLAAGDFEVSPSDVIFENGRYMVAGTDLSIEFRDLIRRHAVIAAPHPLDTKTGMPAVMAWPTGAHVAEVEIDLATGVLDVVRYVAVDDCGRLINPVIVGGQLHGGIVQGLGQGLGENCVYESGSGQLLTGSFMDYYMPRASDVPSFELHDRPTLSPTNSLGAKGAGEAGTTGAVPAIAGAIRDALLPLGVDHVDMPYTPNQLWAAIESAKRG